MKWNQTSTDVEPQAPPQQSPPAPPEPDPRRPRRVPVRAAIVAALLVVVGALGFFLVTTRGELDTARSGEASFRAQLATIRSQLGSTKAILRATQADLGTAGDAAAARQQVDNYVGVIFTNIVALQKNIVALAVECPGSACSAGLANVEADVASFHADGAYSLKVPSAMATADADITRAVSEYLSGAKLLVAGIDGRSQSTQLNAVRELSGADAAFATAVSDVGNALLLGEN